jgi:hypothetical protein
LDVDDGGTATVLFGASHRTFTMTRPRHGSWGARSALGRSGGPGTLVVNSTGEAVATWQAGRHVRASWRSSSAPWPRAIKLGVGSDLGLIAAIGVDDTAAVAWFRSARRDQVLLKAAVHPSR